MKKQASILATMAIHMAAFGAKVTALGGFREKREDPTVKTIADAIDKINNAFEEYKKTNDQRIESIKSGSSTEALDAKLARIDEHINAITEAKSRLEKLETKLSRPGLGGVSGADESREEAEYKSAFCEWIRAPQDSERKSRVESAGKALLAAKSKGGEREARAAQVVTTTGAAGGYALPEVIESTILRILRDVSPMRQIATVRTVGSTDYKELVDINGAAFEWLGETDTRNQTNTSDLYEIVPTFGMASAKPQASEESLDDLFFNVEDWLITSATEAIDQGEGAAFVSGNGTKKPTGFLAGPAPVATADASRAFGTLQYVASAQAAALPTSLDTFYDLIYSLRARYRRNASWATNKLTLASVRKYKDTTGQYLWQPTITAGQPDTFMGYPVAELEDMPVVAANAFPIAFGDFKEGYLIADRVGLRMTRDEITTPGFIKFYVRRRVGGKLRNTEAIKLLKIAAS